jgi:N-hydroxyarylamine O-acetyltransferase
MMDCSAYLDCIGFVGRPAPDLATLRRLQRCHLQQIAYENLDVQLGKRVTLGSQEAFAKLVGSSRGGWCYEMNGLFAWALESIGFRVMPMTGAGLRAQIGPTAIGNHLVLSVQLDEPYLVDVGFGDGPSEPLPIRQGTFRQGWRTLRLEALGEGWWRFHNYAGALARSFDFQHRPADWTLLAAQSDRLQTSPQSQFVQNAICVRHLEDGFVALVGRVLKKIEKDATTRRVLSSADEYVETLADTFGIVLPEAAELWPTVTRRHESLFGVAA